MATAIIGTGNIGGALARHLARGGEPVVLAAKDEANAAALAQELGELPHAASVEEASARRTPSSSPSGSTRSRN
jgi:predicted dinucleotide-binding enzyme